MIHRAADAWLSFSLRTVEQKRTSDDYQDLVPCGEGAFELSLDRLA